MKKYFLILCLLLTPRLSSAASGRTGFNSLSWSALYGYAQNVNDMGVKPSGQAYKFQFGSRIPSHFEFNLFLKYVDQKGDLTFSSIEGDIERTNMSYGLHVGYWITNYINVHAGFAFHGVRNEVNGNFSANQKTTINSTYDLNNQSLKGLFAGGDLVLLQSKSFQLFTNYDYYHLNHTDDHDWEAMVGIRFYSGSAGGSGGSGGPSKFEQFLKWIFNKGT